MCRDLSGPAAVVAKHSLIGTPLAGWQTHDAAGSIRSEECRKALA